jgi:Concanavalin A-like lectin/glucanases superfamily/Right handed beta helix region
MRKFFQCVPLLLLSLLLGQRVRAQLLANEVYAAKYPSLSAAVTAIGATPSTLVIAQTLPSGAPTTVPATLTLDFRGAGMIDCGNVASAVTIQGPVIIPEKKQTLINCAAGNVRFAGRSITIFPEMFGGSDWGAQLMVALAACPTGYACNINLRNIAGGTTAADVTVLTNNAHILFGPYTYTFGAGFVLKMLPSAAHVDGVEIAGQSQYTTTIACNATSPCFYVAGTLATISSEYKFVIQNNIVVGDRTFTALSGDISGTSLVAGDFIKVCDFAINTSNKTFDHQRCNDRQVASVVGTTVTVDDPFTFNFNLQGRTAFEKYKFVPRGLYVHDLKIQQNSTTTGRPSYFQYVHDLRIENIINYALGQSNNNMSIYAAHNVILRNNTFIAGQSGGGSQLEFAQTDGGLIYGNRFTCDTNGSGPPAVVIDFGVNNVVIDSNVIECTAGTGLALIEADNNLIVNNQIATNNATVCLAVRGNNNVLRDNTTTKCSYGIEVATSPYNLGIVTADWQPSHSYAALSCVVEVPDNGWAFCTQAGGTSGANQPTWNEVQSAAWGVPPTGATTTDNTVTWTGVKYHTNVGTRIEGHKHYQIGAGGILIQPGVINPIIKNVTADNTAGTTILTLNPTKGNGIVTGLIGERLDTAGRYQLDGPSTQSGYADIAGGVGVTALANPTGLAATQGPNTCVTCGTSFSYYVAAVAGVSNGLETAATQVLLASQDAVSANHKNKITWSPVTGAACYNVYGRTSGTEQLMSACQIGTTFTDDGTITPGTKSPPLVNATGALNVAGSIMATGTLDVTASQYTVATLPAYAGVVLSLTPAGYWKMNEASGNLADSSGNANTAVAAGAGLTYHVAGSIRDDADYAVTMPGSGNPRWAVAASGSLPSGNLFSLSFVFKKAVDGTLMRIWMQQSNGFSAHFDTDNKLHFGQTGLSDITASTNTITGTGWHHVVMTKNGTPAKIYLDGADVTGTVTARTLAPAANGEWFGIYAPTLAAGNWNGSLDEFAVWTRELSSAEASTLYTAWAKAKNGTTAYITDCIPGSSPAVGGGAGALAKYERGQWACGETTRGTALVAGNFVLSAGWGTTPSVTALAGTDKKWQATFTSGGTGQAANPTITLTYANGSWGTAPIASCGRNGGTGTGITGFTVSSTATQQIITAVGTPVAAETYILTCSN